MRLVTLAVTTLALLLLELPSAHAWSLTRIKHTAAPHHHHHIPHQTPTQTYTMCEPKQPTPETPKEDAKADDKPTSTDEKAELSAKIAAIESELVLKRGALADATDNLRDAGEAGYMLLAADFERYRLSSRADIEGKKGFGKLDAMRPLLPALEGFAALQAELDDGTSDDDAATVHKYYAGIHKQLLTLLEAEGVETFEVAVGDKYEWRRHAEVERRASDDVPANCILEVREQGYLMGGEVLRTASCVVSSGPDKPAADEPTDEVEADADAGVDAGSE
jgi:molecular chaperone GrpE